MQIPAAPELNMKTESSERLALKPQKEYLC